VKTRECVTVQNALVSSHMLRIRLSPVLYSISFWRLPPPSPSPVVKAHDLPRQNLLSGTLSLYQFRWDCSAIGWNAGTSAKFGSSPSASRNSTFQSLKSDNSMQHEIRRITTWTHLYVNLITSLV
jgi:hypothetical protein